MALRFFVERIRSFKEFAIPEVFDMFLTHLEASKVPSMESLPTTFARIGDKFRNPIVERAFLCLQGLTQAAVHKEIIRSDTLIRGLVKSRWPGMLAWLGFFYVGCFDRNLGNASFREGMERLLNSSFVLPTSGDDLTIAVGAVPGTIRLATMLCLLDNSSSYVTKDGLHLGTTTLMYFLQIEGCKYSFDELVEASRGDPGLIVDTAIKRLNRALKSLDVSLQNAMIQLSVIMTLRVVPKHHPLSLALFSRNPVGIATNVILRLLDIPYTSAHYSPMAIMNVPYCVSMCFSDINAFMKKDVTSTKPVLQALEAGALAALAACTNLSSSFNIDDRRTLVHTLEHFTLLSSHIAVARQASAELERVESTLPLQERINTSTPDIRDAWKVLYQTIRARREILAQMQMLNSTPMSCDNVSLTYAQRSDSDDHSRLLMLTLNCQCFRFDERANFKKCAGCQRAHYCSKECQTRAWKEKGHKAECKDLKQKAG